MLLHTSDGYEFDSENPLRVSFVLRYAGDSPKYVTTRFEYKNKSQIKTSGIFRYVENITYGSGTFLYNSKEYLSKPHNTKYLKDEVSTLSTNVGKKSLKDREPQLINYGESIKNLKEVIRPLFIDNNSKGLKDELALLEKSLILSLAMPLKSITNNQNLSLASCLSYINKEISYSVSSMLIWSIDFGNTHKSLQLLERLRILDKVPSQALAIVPEKNIGREGVKEFITPDIFIHIDIEKSTYGLSKSVNSMDRDSSINYIINEDRIRPLSMDNDSKFLGRLNNHVVEKQLDPHGLKPQRLRLIVKAYDPKGINRVGLHELYKETFRLFKKISLNSIQLNNTLKFLKRITATRLFKLSYRSGSVISRTTGLKFKNRYLKNIQVFRMTKNLFKGYLENHPLRFINKPKNKSYKREIIRNINLAKDGYVGNESLLSLSKKIPQFVEKLWRLRIGKYSPKPLIKDSIFPIYLPNDKFIGKPNTIAITQTYQISDLELMKRWWVVPPGLEEDIKILPPDYNYGSNPLMGSMMLGYNRIVFPPGVEHDKYIETLINNIKIKYALKKEIIPYEHLPKLYYHHPNSPQINLYIEHDDTSRGLYEMPLAINIMMEMVNLVGLIVHHQASQLCFCTGQEAMWFIMEILDDWLNLESTIEKLNTLGALEHYNRCYRWVRWEAEKVYFDSKADNHRFMGLKYSGQLLANLIEYMKYHHFNVVPIWPDLDKMDYWRNQSNAPNTSIVLDKIKGERHKNIETQRLDKKATEGMPKLK